MSHLYAVSVRTRDGQGWSYAVTANAAEEAIAKVIELRRNDGTASNAAFTVEVVWLANTTLMTIGIDGEPG